MKIIKDNIWNYWSKGYWVVVTTNGVVKKNGEAVMGAGIALQAKKKFPGLAKELGSKLQNSLFFGNKLYFFENYRIITFPTKYHWKDKSDIELIKISFKELEDYLFYDNTFKDMTKEKIKVAIPKVGCCNGKLKWDDVKDLYKIIEKYNVVIVDKKG